MDNTYYLEKTANGTQGVSLESKMYEHRVIFLNDVIDSVVVQDTIRKLIVLMEENNNPITIIINSPGGNLQAGLALIDVMEASTCIIRTLTLGISASMSAIIAAAGTRGYRYMSDHSRMMIHEPLLQNGISGSCSSIQATAKSILESKLLINTLLTKYTGKDQEKIDEATNHDNYMVAKEALEFGLIDKVIEGQELIAIMKGE